ncbi:MAG: phage tail sheath subtilisin-like domain-containing protein, partial [Candidatus Poseidoniales archaeon]
EYSYDAKSGSPNNLLGKVHYTHNTQKLFGVGTAFSKQVNVGDFLMIAGQNLEVQQIISDTELVMMSNIIGTVPDTNPVPWARRWKYSNYFGKEPSTSYDIRQVNGDITGNYNDQMHMVVIDVDGKITGEIGKVIESYGFLSLAKDGKDDYKNPTYYVNRVNNASTWIRWSNHLLPNINTNWGAKSLGTVFKTYNKNSGMSGVSPSARTFTAGSDGNAVANEDMFKAIEIFKSKELWELDFFLTGWTNPEIDYHITISKMIQAAEERKDCVVCVSGQFNRIILGKSDTDAMTSEMIAWRGGILDSSYAIMDGNFKYQYDPYNDTYRWVTLSGDVAGLMARTDAEYKPWFSPAGHNRGQIKNVVKLAFSPTQSQRDAMYLDQINPVITVRGEGTLLYGDKTMQRIASAFDRINVRRLFISMKDFVVGQARLKLFEFNTPATRAQFRREIENYLTLVQTQQGLSDYRVICDETNNTNDLIEQNRFVADIYVKPNYVINFIKLNFTAVGQTVEFSDLGV